MNLLWLLLIPLLGSKSKPAPARPGAAPSGRKSLTATTTQPTKMTGVWVWPLPMLGGRAPVVSDGYGSPRGATAHQAAHTHVGVDVMYRRPSPLAGKLVYPLVDHGSRGFELPEGTPVLAAHDGKVWSAGKTALGWRVVIDHSPLPYATVYQHLESIDVPEHRHGKQIGGGAPVKVEAGELIGIAGFSPDDGAGIRHLHFELLNPSKQIDPGSETHGVMAGWKVATS